MNACSKRFGSCIYYYFGVKYTSPSLKLYLRGKVLQTCQMLQCETCVALYCFASQTKVTMSDEASPPPNYFFLVEWHV